MSTDAITAAGLLDEDESWDDKEERIETEIEKSRQARTKTVSVEDGELTTVPVDSLIPYPVNQEIYTNADITSLKERIEEHGFKEEHRLLVTASSARIDSGLILSGHRRWRVAKSLGMDEVPVEGVAVATHRDAILRLLLANEYRDKNAAEQVNEGIAWEWVEQPAAADRRKEATGHTQKFGEAQKGETVDKIGQRIGVSGETFRKGRYVKKAAAESDDPEVREVGTKQWEQMESNEQSIHGAYEAVRGAEQLVEKAQEGVEVAREQMAKVKRGEEDIDRALKTVHREERKEQHRRRAKEVSSVPDGEYSVILADPPWQYDHQQTPNREIENQYATMDLDDICELDVPTADDAVLYLWTTAPKLKEGLAVLDSWGFDYVTHAVWDKQKIGMGYWFRGQHELLLVGRRGSVSPPETDVRRSSVISVPRGKHSEKPTEVYELIEEAFPDHPKLEVFARSDRDGWDAWGDEVG